MRGKPHIENWIGGDFINKEAKMLIQAAERQGWEVKPTKKGWMLKPPDKANSAIVIHSTPSDRNWHKVAERRLRKAGLRI